METQELAATPEAHIEGDDVRPAWMLEEEIADYDPFTGWVLIGEDLEVGTIVECDATTCKVAWTDGYVEIREVADDGTLTCRALPE